MGATEVARTLKIGRASVYRILEDSTGEKAGRDGALRLMPIAGFASINSRSMHHAKKVPTLALARSAVALPFSAAILSTISTTSRRVMASVCFSCRLLKSSARWRSTSRKLRGRSSERRDSRYRLMRVPAAEVFLTRSAFFSP
ncbi:MAG: hypothetical protein WB610_18095 [Rhodomicrobium sp.]